jgi:uncharacterized protein YecT (DUF1311 family)/serine/threonine protein kinase
MSEIRETQTPRRVVRRPGRLCDAPACAVTPPTRVYRPRFNTKVGLDASAGPYSRKTKTIGPGHAVTTGEPTCSFCRGTDHAFLERKKTYRHRIPMAPDDFSRSPIPHGLDDYYEILRELRHDDVSTSWLGHEHATHRDVVITVVNPNQLPRRELSSELGADAQLLRAQRHPAVVPVFASHWLPDGSLAIVRPRVRGTTLSQMLQAAGALPLARAVGFLREVGVALDWARHMGITHRGLTSESVCFQQGSGRALVSFGPELSLAAAGVTPTPRPHALELGPVLMRCSDTATLGRLAWEMLTTRPAPVDGDAGAMSVRRGYREPGLADLRPDLPLSVAAEIEGALRCERDPTPRGPMAFIAALAAAAGAEDDVTLSSPVALADQHSEELGPVPSPVVRRGDPESISERTAWTTPPVPMPRQPQRRGGGAIMAVTVVAVLVLAAVALFINRQDGPDSRIADARQGTSTTVSAGDVEFDRSTIDTGVLIVPGSGRRAPEPLPLPMPASPPPEVTGRTVFAPPSMQPLPPATPEATPIPSAVVTGDPCSSADEEDQQACLRGHIARNDVQLNRTYRELTSQLREDSQAVDDLRTRQREWLSQRDADCRSRVDRSGTWAGAYAQCLAERSDERVRELRSEIDRRREP